MSSRFTTEELETIAHGLGHYDLSHGNLPLFKLHQAVCDRDAEWIENIGYRDTRQVFAELARLRRKVAGEVPEATCGDCERMGIRTVASPGWSHWDGEKGDWAPSCPIHGIARPIPLDGCNTPM
jgi:hypothetical protein